MNKTAPRRRTDLSDWIQEAVIERADELGLTAYALAKAATAIAAKQRGDVPNVPGDEGQWSVSQNAVRQYLQRRSSMGSHKLQYVLEALGITLKLEPR